MRDTPRATTLADLRIMQHRVCLDCGHEWDQPASTGRCPACHTDRVANTERRVSELTTL